ncbi:MAG TPA: FUSC family protein, partial [Novosphingobium sp.]|nr:FUSC family protein [Novosphingobium sp.]
MAFLPRWPDMAPARLLDDGECVASVLLAIALAHLLGGTNVSWAAFSGFVVMRGHMAETLRRGVLRMVGTLLGAGLALVVTPQVLGRPLLAMAVVVLVATISLYGAITARRAYAWLLFGLTFVMIVIDKLERPQVVLAHFAESRVMETLAGTLACVVVGLASALTLRRRW